MGGGTSKQSTAVSVDGVACVVIPPDDKAILETALRNFSFVHKGCNLDKFFKIFRKETYQRNDVIVSEGQEGAKLFILVQGQLSVQIGGDLYRYLETGEAFGELSLLYHIPYHMKVSVSSATPCTVYSMDSQAYRCVQDNVVLDNVHIRAGFLAQIPELELFPVEKLSILASHLMVKTFTVGEFIVEKGIKSDMIFIIEEGRAKIDLQLDPLLLHPPVPLTDPPTPPINATTPNEIDSLLGIIRGIDPGWSPVEAVRYGANYFEFTDTGIPSTCLLKKGSIVGDKILKGKIGGLHGWIWYDSKQGTKNEIVTLKSSKSKPELKSAASTKNLSSAPAPVRTMARAQSIASFEIHGEKAGAIYPYGVECMTDVRIVYFTIDSFERLFGHTEHAIAGNFHGNEPVSVDKDRHMFFETKGFEHLEKITETSVGSQLMGYYTVIADATLHHRRANRAVHTKEKEVSTQYYIRMMSKEKVLKTKQLDRLKTEMEILEEMNSPYTTNLCGVFQTTDELFFCFDVINQGLGDLWHLLYDKLQFDRRILAFESEEGVVGLPFDLIQFYSVCLVDALAYIHSKQIIFRNLKAENIMFDSRGHIKLVGFGLSKRLPFSIDGTNNQTSLKYKTLTFCGSAEYMAPEIVLFQGYDYAVDLWSLGIVIYEMMFAKTPFASPKSHHAVIVSNKDGIMSQMNETLVAIQKTFVEGVRIPELESPFDDLKSKSIEQRGVSKGFMYEHAIDLVKCLLEPDPRKRLGNMSYLGTADLMSHPFFSGIDAEAVALGQMAPPITVLENLTAIRKYKELLGMPKLEKYTGDQHLFSSFSDCLHKKGEKVSHHHFVNEGEAQDRSLVSHNSKSGKHT